MSSDPDTTIEFIDGYTVTKTGTCENRFAGKHEKAALQIGLLQSAVERLRDELATYRTVQKMVDCLAIVEVLPKTKNGVPVVPGDAVWIVVNDMIEERFVQWTAQPDLFVEWDYPGYFVGRGIDGPPVMVSQCYSTRVAAQAAEGE